MGTSVIVVFFRSCGSRRNGEMINLLNPEIVLEQG